MKSGIRFAVGFAFLVAMLITPSAMAIDATPVPEFIGDPIEIVQPVLTGGEKAGYQGTLRIYMSEPFSRYTDLYDDNYAFGLLDWAENPVTLNIGDGVLLTHNVQWDASNAGFVVDPDNLVAQAVVSNGTPYMQYSDPPGGAAFWAYWADAAAQAAPGVPGQNLSNQDFTHTVFIEELTQKY